MKYTPATVTAVTILILFSLATFTGCITKKKVQKYLHENPEFSSTYCAEAFPIKESTDTIYYNDTARQNRVVNDLLQYADSLLNELESRHNISKELNTDFGETKISRELANDEPPILTKTSNLNLNKIRADIERKVREATKPCADSLPLINKVKENAAKAKSLELANLRIANENEMLRNDLKAMTGKRNKNMYWLWALIALIAVRTYLKLRFKIKWL